MIGVVLTHAYTWHGSWLYARLARCVSVSDNFLLQWFHRYDTTAPDDALFILMAGISDMRTLQQDDGWRKVLCVSAFFLMLGCVVDAANFGVSRTFCYLQPAQSLWMHDYLHGPGRESGACVDYIGVWFFRVRAGMALLACCFVRVLKSTGLGGSSYAFYTGIVMTLFGWVSLFLACHVASFLLAVLALGCWLAHPCRITLLGTEWPAAAPTVALLATICSTAAKHVTYNNIWMAARAEILRFLGFDDVWILSYFVFPICFGGFRFPGPIVQFMSPKAPWVLALTSGGFGASALVMVARALA